jgi:WD40 repeat protein
MIVLQGPKERLERLCFAPDGQCLLAPTRHILTVWDHLPAGETEPLSLPFPSVAEAHFIPGGRVAILDGASIRLHNLATGQGNPVEFPPPYTAAGLVSIVPGDQHFIAAQSSHLTEPRGRLTCRAIGAPESTIWSVTTTRHFYSAALFLHDVSRFAVIEWWNGERGTEYGPAFVTRDATTGAAISEVRASGRGHTHPYCFPVASPDRRQVATRSGRWIGVYRTEDFAQAPVIICNDSKKDFTGIAFHPSGRFLAATSNDTTVKLYDTTTWTVAKTFTWNIGRMRSIAFSPDGTLAAAGSDTARSSCGTWTCEGSRCTFLGQRGHGQFRCPSPRQPLRFGDRSAYLELARTHVQYRVAVGKLKRSNMTV